MDKTFLTYNEWKETAKTLHLLLQIIAKIRMEHNGKHPEWIHGCMSLTINGLTTGIIADEHSSFEIAFNLMKHHISMHNADGRKVHIRLQDGVSIAQYYRQIQHALGYIGAPTAIELHPQDFGLPADFERDESPRRYDEAAVCLFQKNLLFAYSVLDKYLSLPTVNGGAPVYHIEAMELSCSICNKGGHLPKLSFHPGNAKMPIPSFLVTYVHENRILTLEEALLAADSEARIMEFFSDSLKSFG